MISSITMAAVTLMIVKSTSNIKTGKMSVKTQSVDKRLMAIGINALKKLILIQMAAKLM